MVQPPVLPLGLLGAPAVSNAASLLLGAGVKVCNSIPLPFRSFFCQESFNYFSQPVGSWQMGGNTVQ